MTKSTAFSLMVRCHGLESAFGLSWSGSIKSQYRGWCRNLQPHWRPDRKCQPVHGLRVMLNGIGDRYDVAVTGDDSN